MGSGTRPVQTQLLYNITIKKTATGVLPATAGSPAAAGRSTAAGVTTIGGFNVSNLMGITRRKIDIGKKITFYF